MIKLHDYQVKGRDYLLTHRYAILADEMGLGKSFQTIATFKFMSGPILVIVPGMLRVDWVRMVEQLTDYWDDWNYDIQLHLQGKLNFKPGKVVHVLSYDALIKLPKHLNPECIVFDEAHYLKNLMSKRTQIAHEYVFETKPKFMFLLSGTPIKNNVTEFYSLLKLLSMCPSDTNGKRLQERSFYAFAARFSYPRKRTIYVRGEPVEIDEFEGIRNKPLLKDYLRFKYLRRKTSKVIGLPPLIQKDVLLSEKTTRKDESVKKAFMESLSGTHISTGKAENALAKVPKTVEYVKGIMESNGACVIFTDHVEACEDISKELKKSGIKNYCITGKIRTDLRSEVIFQFQNDPIKSVLVCTIGSASTGYTLTRAKHLVFNDLPWVPADLYQARKRIHRVGQDQTCFIHYILSSPADLYIKEILEEKIENLKGVL